MDKSPEAGWVPEGTPDTPNAPARAVALARLGRGMGRNMGRHLLRRLVDLALPPLCMACRSDVEAPGCLCAGCWSRLDLIAPPLCDRLGVPLAYTVETGGRAPLSAQALADPPAYGRARAVAAFGDVARDLVHGLKYADRLDLAAPLGAMMARAGADILAGADALVPVPLYGVRLWRRRFNQSAALAGGVATIAGVPVRYGLLERSRHTTPQVGLDRAARARNVAGAFRVPEGARGAVAGRHLVIIDDVLTTGATIDACTKALQRAGARKVDVLVFARVVDGAAAPIS